VSRYISGEAIKKGDRIRYGSGSGVVEFVADPDVSDPETAYFVDEYGGGCMLLTEAYGRVFLTQPEHDEDLAFVSRAQTTPTESTS
jgi:hypothetical protein